MQQPGNRKSKKPNHTRITTLTEAENYSIERNKRSFEEALPVGLVSHCVPFKKLQKETLIVEIFSIVS